MPLVLPRHLHMCSPLPPAVWCALLVCGRQLLRKAGRPEVLEKLVAVARADILPGLLAVVTSDTFRGCDLTSRALEGLIDVRCCAPAHVFFDVPRRPPTPPPPCFCSRGHART
jgi:hypothetical protein